MYANIPGLATLLSTSHWLMSTVTSPLQSFLRSSGTVRFPDFDSTTLTAEDCLVDRR